MVAIRPLTPADIPAAQRLRQQAGWNQADDDWRRLLAWDPAGCWAAGDGGEVVGTTAVTSYGQRIAWIGMVLVDEARRRRGIGRALLTHALEYLDRRGIQTVALDSTPEGQPLYASLGFVDAFELARWRGPFPTPVGRNELRPYRRGPGTETGEANTTTLGASPAPPGGGQTDPVGAQFIAPAGLTPPPGFTPPAGSSAYAGEVAIRPLAPADLPAVVAYDARIFGVERGHILAALQAAEDAGTVLAERHGTIVGYALSRPGARAWHLGPLAADDPATAERLAWAAIGPPTGAAVFPELVFDAVMPNQHAVTLARALGLAPVRRFIRMTRGSPPPAVDLGRLYTSAGPELG